MEKAARYCEAIRGGASQTAAAKEIETADSTVRLWMREVEGFAAQVKEAKEKRNFAMEERIFALLGRLRDISEGRATVDRVQLKAIEVEIDTVKWMLTKVYPQKYGDKSQLEVTGKDGAELLPHHTAEEDRQFAALVAAAQLKVRSEDEKRRKREADV